MDSTRAKGGAVSCGPGEATPSPASWLSSGRQVAEGSKPGRDGKREKSRAGCPPVYSLIRPPLPLWVTSASFRPFRWVNSTSTSLSLGRKLRGRPLQCTTRSGRRAGWAAPPGPPANSNSGYSSEHRPSAVPLLHGWASLYRGPSELGTRCDGPACSTQRLPGLTQERPWCAFLSRPFCLLIYWSHFIPSQPFATY